MEPTNPYDLPLRRFYLHHNVLPHIEEEEAWVEAESAASAAQMAKTLYGPFFTGFSHEEYRDPKTGDDVRYDYTPDGALETLNRLADDRKGQV